MSNETPLCSTCSHWFGLTLPKQERASVKSELPSLNNLAIDIGQCRRYAPGPGGSPTSLNPWSICSADAFCGDWEKK